MTDRQLVAAKPAAAKPRSRAMQTRLAIGMTALALGTAALVALGGFLLASRLGPDPEPVVQTRLEQVGNRILVVQVRQDTSGAATASAARRDALVWVLAAVGAAFVPAAALAWLVAGRLLRPVQQMTEVIERVDSPATPERSGVDRPDELGALADGLDRMLDRLDAQRRQQQELLHEVIHELRTPLAVATTNVELVRAGPRLDDESAAQLAAAQRAIERMARTVDDLANHGRLVVADGIGSATGLGAWLDLAAAARTLADEHAGPAQLRNVHLVTNGPSTLAVPGDPDAVHTAAANLVANAVRLAPSGSTITVAWGLEDRWAWLAVADQGPGLGADDQVRVFDRYWQGRYDRARPCEDAGPRGIGLTIARQVIEAQGGRLTLTSTDGIGSTFTMWLPRSAEAKAADVVATDGIHSLVDPLADREPAPTSLAPAEA